MSGRPNVSPRSSHTWSAKWGTGGDFQISSSYSVRWTLSGLTGGRPSILEAFGEGSISHFLGTLSFVTLF
jgi:hypothetical protein